MTAWINGWMSDHFSGGRNVKAMVNMLEARNKGGERRSASLDVRRSVKSHWEQEAANKVWTRTPDIRSEDEVIKPVPWHRARSLEAPSSIKSCPGGPPPTPASPDSSMGMGAGLDEDLSWRATTMYRKDAGGALMRVRNTSTADEDGHFPCPCGPSNE